MAGVASVTVVSVVVSEAKPETKTVLSGTVVSGSYRNQKGMSPEKYIRRISSHSSSLRSEPYCSISSGGIVKTSDAVVTIVVSETVVVSAVVDVLVVLCGSVVSVADEAVVSAFAVVAAAACFREAADAVVCASLVVEAAVVVVSEAVVISSVVVSVTGVSVKVFSVAVVSVVSSVEAVVALTVTAVGSVGSTGGFWGCLVRAYTAEPAMTAAQTEDAAAVY